MSKFSCVAVGALLLGQTVGCSSIATPDWNNPGPAVQQRARAERFDPYPENETGPLIPGARPPGYQTPVPEPARARWMLWNSRR